MLEENTGRFILINKEVKDLVQLPDILTEAAECIEKGRNGRMVYEVIRLINGVPLFFEDHYERMKRSYESAFSDPLNSSKAREPLISEIELRKLVDRLAEANSQVNCNIKLIAFTGEEECRTLGYISKHFYPPLQMVNSGVPTELFLRERENPNIKLIDLEYKEKIAKIKAKQGVFEVLLVNRDGDLTEGSASNLFFVEGDVVYTAPGDKVLKGITRKYVITACLDSGFPVRETFISVDGLDRVEGAFLSGTSLKVLPVSSIDDREYASAKNPVIVKIRDAYDRLLEGYIESHKK